MSDTSPRKSLIEYDPWLEPHHATIDAREAYISRKMSEVLDGSSVRDFALGHQYFGLHRLADSWVLREWAPNASRIILVGDFTDWQEQEDYELAKGDHGQWSIELPPEALQHGDKYKLRIYWPGGNGWRLPAYTTYALQDPDTHDYSAAVWHPNSKYVWRHSSPPPPKTPLIYEAHIGMSSEEPKVASFKEFTDKVLPRIKRADYNTIQLMAIAEHPYYGSFGYHVSNYFAVSSRFGTPDDFKNLVDQAHGMGLRIILDIVHSHAAKNEAEGLSRLDGSDDTYFHDGDRGHHPAWDSRVFDYGKPEVVHMLMSNCRWWLDEYRVDGFRFDGVTSMIYTHHGLEKDFTTYDDYYGDDVDLDALTYLRLANQLVHELRPEATTIAEEMSGMPGIAAPIDAGGLGFDYRLQMGAPDLWIKTLKEQADEDWDLGHLVHTLHSKRPEEYTINYVESHDQALVGDKTLIFQLIDKEMYWHMHKSGTNLAVERGLALHKMIRLLTASTHGGGYMNFMGNEFGHPEWIDFPREGNNWSYQYARRQWSLTDDADLRYQDLARFDQALMELLSTLPSSDLGNLEVQNDKNIVSFSRGKHIFVFNFSPTDSYANYSISTPAGTYQMVLDSDSIEFGGHARIDHSVRYKAALDHNEHRVRLYLPARTGFVLKKIAA